MPCGSGRSVHAVTGSGELRIIGIDGVPEVRPGDDLAGLIGDAIAASGAGLEASDVVVVTHKIVSKAEGQVVDLRGVEPSVLARQYGERWDKDPRKTEIVLRRGAAHRAHGITASSSPRRVTVSSAPTPALTPRTPRAETVVFLPEDPDASAARLRQQLGARFGVHGGGRAGGDHQRLVWATLAEGHRQRRGWRRAGWRR